MTSVTLRLLAGSALVLAGALACGDDGDGDPVVPPEYGFCEPNPEPFPTPPTPSVAATLPFLHVEGTDVVDEGGTPVALRGFNFGSWSAVNHAPLLSALSRKEKHGVRPKQHKVNARCGVAGLRITGEVRVCK